MNQTLIQEILEVVEQAAIASAKLTGLGQKDEADAAAVEAMRLRMGKIEMKGKIVIGEGERDEAPMLYIGEEVGSGSGPGVDFAVDPCEGTNLCANNQRGSMAVLAASDTGGLFNAPDFYMNKLAAPPAAKGKVDISNSATKNLKILSDCLDLSIEELTVVVMDRTRHKDLIKEIRGCGAKVQPISDGDVQAAIACGFAGTGTHCLMGIGAAPEGVITATAVKAMGGFFEGKLHFMDETFKTRAVEMLGDKIDNVWSSDDLCQSNDSFFIASGVCSGWIPGVKFQGNKAIVTSKIIFGDSKESEIVTNEYSIGD